MKLNAPKKITWIISLILGIIGALGVFITIPFISGIAFWIEVVALALLLLATAMKGL